MYMGIDIGSVSTNAVIINNRKEILGYEILSSGYQHRQTAGEIMKRVCRKAQIREDEIEKIVGTGYGRYNIPGICKTVTEITCHAVGVHHLFQDARLVIDIGGQDSKVIWLTEDGYADFFVMNDKCSAGTGRFLEVMASVLKMDLNEFSEWGYKARQAFPISSTCTVFAESEVISAVSMGVPRENIVAGICKSIAERILSMAGIKEYLGKTVITGGVAKSMGVVEYMKQRLPQIYIPQEPQITGALGAAILASL